MNAKAPSTLYNDLSSRGELKQSMYNTESFGFGSSCIKVDTATPSVAPSQNTNTYSYNLKQAHATFDQKRKLPLHVKKIGLTQKEDTDSIYDTFHMCSNCH